jgi:hypothetical protein
MRPDYNGEPPETVEKETLFEIIDEVDAQVVTLEETVEERDARLRREERRQFQQEHLAKRQGK